MREKGRKTDRMNRSAVDRNIPNHLIEALAECVHLDREKRRVDRML